ncbi:MAG: class I SAM-dependent methyltransferase [Deltaproteobacteria bacterium]|nr:class I SAM-dependent methyltransferase [Deltaproteobacteria bacterium]
MSSTLWERVRCPDCLGTLAPEAGAWRCGACAARYGGAEVPCLIGAKSSLNASEVATQDSVSDLYEGVRYNRDYSRAYHRHTLDQLVSIAAPRGEVLDDGCGPGLFMEYLRDHAHRMDRYVGIDVSSGMIAKASGRRARGAGDREVLLQADSCRLPFADASFDTVFVRGLLHHLPDPGAGMREVARVLRPGGSAVVLEPNKTIISAAPRFFARKGKHFDEDHKNFRARYIRDLVAASLRVDATHFYGYLAYPLLGYPDVASFDKLLPLGKLAPALMAIDDNLARLPAVRSLGWGVIFLATKPAS